MRHCNTPSKNQTNRVWNGQKIPIAETFLQTFSAALGRRLKDFPRPSDTAPDNINAGAECLAVRQGQAISDPQTMSRSSRVRLGPYAGNTGYGDYLCRLNVMKHALTRR